jgi:hypothetical protein
VVASRKEEWRRWVEAHTRERDRETEDLAVVAGWKEERRRWTKAHRLGRVRDR